MKCLFISGNESISIVLDVLFFITLIFLNFCNTSKKGDEKSRVIRSVHWELAEIIHKLSSRQILTGVNLCEINEKHNLYNQGIRGERIQIIHDNTSRNKQTECGDETTAEQREHQSVARKANEFFWIANAVTL